MVGSCLPIWANVPAHHAYYIEDDESEKCLSLQKNALNEWI